MVRETVAGGCLYARVLNARGWPLSEKDHSIDADESRLAHDHIITSVCLSGCPVVAERACDRVVSEEG